MLVAVCPGQGAERPDMGRGWDGPLLDVASEATGRDVRRILHRGAPGLDEASVLQAALVALALTALAPWQGRIARACGHSLGELTALAALGAWTPEQAVRLAAARGRAMGQAAALRPGAMFWLPREAVDAAIAAAAARGEVSVASDNPDGVVLGLDRACVPFVRGRFGARELPSLGAWHHASMHAATAAFAAALDACPPRPVAGFLPGGDPRARLLAQLTETCRWRDTLEGLRAEPLSAALVPVPGRLVAQHLAQVLPDLPVRRIERPGDGEGS